MDFASNHLKLEHKQHIAQERAICRNPHNSSNWDSRITRRMGYKHNFCQNVSTQKLLLLLLS